MCEPTTPTEASRIEWTVARVIQLVRDGGITDGLSPSPDLRWRTPSAC
jgi:hypothetical protein